MDNYFHFDQKITFSKAVSYNLNPVRGKRTWRDATGGFGDFVPLQGWIEVYDTDGYCGRTFCSTGMLDNILPLVMTGETRTYNEWYHYLYWRLRNFGFQSGQICDLGQFDRIMLEIMAEREGKPLHRFLGAKKDWAAIYKGGGSLLLTDEELVDDMTRYVREGNTTVKFKVGSDWGRDMMRDVERLRLVREAVGPDIGIAVDGNQVWEVEDAVHFADLIRPYEPEWFEEPIHSHDMNGIKEVCERTGMVIGFGESMRNAFAFETYAEKGVGHLMPLVGRVSAMGDLLKVRDLAREKGLMFSSGGTVWQNASFGALYEGRERLEHHEPMTQPMGECLEVKPEERGGRLYLHPDLPGSPVRLAVKKLEENGTLESIKIVHASANNKTFAVRASY